MVDWTAPETVAANAQSFTMFLHTIFGLYIWEWVMTLDFDLQFIMGYRKFRWPLITYFYGRYAMLVGLTGFIVAVNTKTEINCQVLYIILQVLGNTALGMATINLAIRTMAIWNQNIYIVVPLIVIILGQFGIILRSVVNVKAIYVPGVGCATTNVDSTVFAAMYIYTMVADFIVLVLTSYKLLANASLRKIASRSPIVSLLFKDGLIYFIVAFIGNLVAVVFSLLKLNDVMSIIADIPATTFATIMACRCVRRLNNYVSGESVHMFSSGPVPPSAAVGPTQNGQIMSSGVRIQMHTITHADAESDIEGQNMAQKSHRQHTTTTETDIHDDMKHSPI